MPSLDYLCLGRVDAARRRQPRNGFPNRSGVRLILTSPFITRSRDTRITVRMPPGLKRLTYCGPSGWICTNTYITQDNAPTASLGCLRGFRGLPNQFRYIIPALALADVRLPMGFEPTPIPRH